MRVKSVNIDLIMNIYMISVSKFCIFCCLFINFSSIKIQLPQISFKIMIMKYILNTFLVMALSTAISQAKPLKVYKHIDKNGIIHYSSKKPATKNYRIMNIKCPECAWKSKVNWHNTPLVTGKFEKEIQTAAAKWDVDPSLIKAIIHAESSFIADNESSAGAQGLMQLMPATQKTYSVTDPFDPLQNIQAGTAYLKHLLNTYDNNVRLSLAAYNAGETAVKKYGNDVPPYKETQNYIKRVNILQKRYK